MRKRYFTSSKKLSVIILFAFFVLGHTKEKPKDTNIICFAAKNEWICAPEDKQQIAVDKVKNLTVDSRANELPLSEVIIKTVSIPKFQEKHPSPDNELVQFQQKPKPKPKPKPLPSRVEQVEYTNETEDSFINYNDYWSYQLIGVSNKQAALKFISDKGLNKEDVLLVKSSRKNNDWWIVLFGLYEDREIGKNSMFKLPNNIKQHWLRPLIKLNVNDNIIKL